MRIKDWNNFQHFKDRRPIWIKLYRTLLDDPQWFSLDPLAAKTLVMLWLLASETDGYLPDIKTISFRLRISEKDVEKCVSKLNHWILVDDSDMISKRYQDDILEKRRDREETEKEEKKKYADCVSMLPSEFQKLVDGHSEEKAWWMIRRLDTYKAANGKKYKSDYHAILNWVVDAAKKEFQPPPAKRGLVL